MKLGILGGGQLGAMMAIRCHSLGIEVVIVDPVRDCSASSCSRVEALPFDNISEIIRCFSGCDAVTYEFENIPLSLVAAISKEFLVCPSLFSLEITQHRAREKEYVSALGISVVPYQFVQSASDLQQFLKQLDRSVIIKRCSHGYDGKGQWRYSPGESIPSLVSSIYGSKPVNIDLVVEDRIPFDFEASCIVVRSPNGEIRCYEICENVHQSGTLVQTLSPGPSTRPEITKKIENATSLIVSSLKHVGVLAVEYFVKAGEIFFNEYAPRVHNSGHWTIEGAKCSQFENHIRACLGLPLGDVSLVGVSAMINLLGTKGDVERLLAVPGLHYHWYNKDIQLGRKLGHVSLCCRTDKEREALIPEVREACKIVI